MPSSHHNVEKCIVYKLNECWDNSFHLYMAWTETQQILNIFSPIYIYYFKSNSISCMCVCVAYNLLYQRLDPMYFLEYSYHIYPLLFLWLLLHHCTCIHAIFRDIFSYGFCFNHFVIIYNLNNLWFLNGNVIFAKEWQPKKIGYFKVHIMHDAKKKTIKFMNFQRGKMDCIQFSRYQGK